VNHEDQPDEGMELVMPFVCVRSKGGPFDDEAFAAGWACGDLDRALAFAEVSNGLTEYHHGTFRTALKEQADLIAMKHGFNSVVFEVAEGWPEWGSITIRRDLGEPDRG
jgi:hypothetical protein